MMSNNSLKYEDFLHIKLLHSSFDDKIVAYSTNQNNTFVLYIIISVLLATEYFIAYLPVLLAIKLCTIARVSADQVPDFPLACNNNWRYKSLFCNLF